MENQRRVIIAGGGASGLMAAIWAARSGAKVTVLEAMERPGKKLLTTGNGRCNLTNMDAKLSSRYHGAPQPFVKAVVEQFDASAVRSFFAELGLLTVEKNGYVYPYTNQASSVLEVLLAELRRLSVKLKLTERIEAIRQEDGIWKVQTATWTYEADRLILACGSKCAPTTGSDGSGYQLAKLAGLQLRPVVPALAPLICEGKALAQAAGVRCMAEVTLWRRDRPDALQQKQTGTDGRKGMQGQAGEWMPDALRQKQTGTENRKGAQGQAENWMPDASRQKQTGTDSRKGAQEQAGDWIPVASEQGEVQWTKYGISGIAVFQLSRHVAAAGRNQMFRVTLDLLKPYQKESGMDPEALFTLLKNRAAVLDTEPAGLLLRGILNEKLIPLMLDAAGIKAKKRCRELSDETLRTLLQVCRSYSLTVSGTKSFDVCQVCAGGVDTAQLSSQTLECRMRPGLYVTGELLDVDGPCGGYNLQWAWSSGYVAGCSAAK